MILARLSVMGMLMAINILILCVSASFILLQWRRKIICENGCHRSIQSSFHLYKQRAYHYLRRHGMVLELTDRPAVLTEIVHNCWVKHLYQIQKYKGVRGLKRTNDSARRLIATFAWSNCKAKSNISASCVARACLFLMPASSGLIRASISWGSLAATAGRGVTEVVYDPWVRGGRRGTASYGGWIQIQQKEISTDGFSKVIEPLDD